MKYKTLKELFTGICDAVRVKKGITEEIDHQELPAEILDIPSVDVSGVTATVADVVAPKVFVDSDGVEQTGINPYEKTATDSEVNIQAQKIAQLSTILDGKASGGGGAVETCKVTVEYGGFLTVGTVEAYYIDADQQFQFLSSVLEGQIEVLKNSFLIFYEGVLNEAYPTTGNAENFYNGGGTSAVYVFGDCIIELI